MSEDYEARLQGIAALQDAGRIDDAAVLLEHLRLERPADARLVFFGGMLALRRGETEQALEQLRAFQRIQPGFAETYAQLGLAYRALDRLDDACSAWQQYRELVPQDPRGSYELGCARLALGDVETAAGCFEQVLRLGGHTAESLVRVGLAYQDGGRLQQAIDHHQRALQITPDLLQARQHLATCLHAHGERERAEAAYRAVLAADPDNHQVLENLGTLCKESGDLEQALQHYRRAMEIARQVPADARELLAREPEARFTSLHKLRLELEQLEHLAGLGKLAPAYEGYIPRYREVISELERDRGAGHRQRLTDAQFSRIGRLMHRLWHVGPGDALPEGALNPTLDAADVVHRYREQAPGLVVIDDLLRPAALEALRAYCLETTFWFDYRKAGGYCGAYMQEGFGNDLLLQIARELRARLPEILGPHPLQQMWAYIYDSRLNGITLHADSAAVNLNFWIAPDEANLDPDSGGLAVYLREAPLDWDFGRYNSQPEALRAFVDGAERVVVPHRSNRLVMFHSNLIHETDRFRFRPGLVNRRINITMLYGERGDRPVAGPDR